MKTATILVENAVFPASNGAPEEDTARVAQLRKFRKREQKLLARHRRKDAGTDIQAQKAMIRELQGSSAYRVCAAVNANKKLPLERRVSLAELFIIGSKTSWNYVPDEVVPVHCRSKRSGGFRTICDFGLKYRTMQYAARGMMFPNFTPKPFQYQFQGKGEFGEVSAAINDVRTHILAGKHWAARLDVHKFFENVREKELCEVLPLQKNVVRLFAVGDDMKAVLQDGSDNTYHNSTVILAQARQGAPQGSALSSKITSSIISNLNWSSKTFLSNWGDDFLLLGSSKEEVTEAAKTLVAKVAALPGGQFSLLIKEIAHLTDSVTFLGHSIKLVGAKTEVEPAFNNDFYGPLEQMEVQLSPMLYMMHKQASLQEKCKAREIIGDMWVFAKSWAAAFNACDHMQEDLAAVEHELRKHVHVAGFSWKDVASYSNPHARWKRRYS